MTKQERIEKFNRKWKYFPCKIEYGIHSIDYIIRCPSSYRYVDMCVIIQALTEAKQIMEMEDDE